VNLADFDYPLPEELIAQEPLADRSASRMLVLDRARGAWEDRMFRDFAAFLRDGDCVVLNDSKVFPSRLYGHRTGFAGHVEVLLTAPVSPDRKTWEALVRPGRKVRSRDRIEFAPGIEAEVLGRGDRGLRTLRFEVDGDIDAAIDRIGHVPLPPYIRRADVPSDRDRYQTVYARSRGSVAAPTAGLHFTAGALEEVRRAGADVAYVTLHVGLGTFQPLGSEAVEANRLHAEAISVAPDQWKKIQTAARVVAIGTTSVRAIESAARGIGGTTDLFIYPGFEFRRTGAMLTNFHLPRSSLLLLVCAFAGSEFAMAAYRHAVEARYRFYSYGDCMLIV
jgi:S-adenosylmethionine:tRNA ribosyltransferase-isomerase